LEKLNEEGHLLTIEPHWNEAEREQLSELFYEALKTEDPTTLIEEIHAIISEIPKAITTKKFSPSSTLCMAA
jgi:RNA polymerase sigma-70 factor (ECF subfamily)